MTVFLLPDGRPFHGGTYFPRTPLPRAAGPDRAAVARAPGRPGGRGREAGRGGPSRDLATEPGTGAGPGPGGPGDGARSAGLLEAAADSLMARFDPEWGGFGRAPKFPQPAMVETLLLAAARTGRRDYLDAVTITLDCMASGGIYDHLGGGFARYSTDRVWLVPHFEKMLYDNALLARLYLHAWQATGAPPYRQVVEEVLGYLLAPPMRIAGAGFASAEDADSEGVEGRFYVWDRNEVEQVGGEAAADWYGTSGAGNWEGHNILFRPARGHLARPREIEQARRALLERRAVRVRPGLDDKVLTEWNSMAVAALAEAGAALRNPDWLGAAEEVGRFMLDRAAPARRRPLAAQLAGRPRPPPGLQRRPRLAGGGVHPPGRGDRPGRLDRGGSSRRRCPDRAVLGCRGERFPDQRARRRGSHSRPHRHPGRGHPLRQLGCRGGPPPPGRPDRREALPGHRRSGDRGHDPRSRRRTRGVHGLWWPPPSLPAAA